MAIFHIRADRGETASGASEEGDEAVVRRFFELRFGIALDRSGPLTVDEPKSRRWGDSGY